MKKHQTHEDVQDMLDAAEDSLNDPGISSGERRRRQQDVIQIQALLRTLTPTSN